MQVIPSSTVVDYGEYTPDGWGINANEQGWRLGENF